MILAIVALLAALADEPAGSTAEPAFAVTVCLSDGQVLGGDEFTREGESASLRIGEFGVDIPTAGLLLRSLGDQVAFVEPGRTYAVCESMARPQWSPRLMRIYTLADGQRLYGMWDTGPDFTVTLFDDHLVLLPGELVTGVEAVPRHDPVYKNARRNVSVVQVGAIVGVTLGVVVLGALVIGGISAWMASAPCFFCG